MQAAKVKAEFQNYIRPAWRFTGWYFWKTSYWYHWKLSEYPRYSSFSVVFNAGLTCRTLLNKWHWRWERVFCQCSFSGIYASANLLDQKLQPGGNVCFYRFADGWICSFCFTGLRSFQVGCTCVGQKSGEIHATVWNQGKCRGSGICGYRLAKTKPAEIRKSIESKIALGRFCSPDEVAEVYKMIIENNYFNGEVIPVSGGYSYKWAKQGNVIKKTELNTKNITWSMWPAMIEFFMTIINVNIDNQWDRLKMEESEFTCFVSWCNILENSDCFIN